MGAAGVNPPMTILKDMSSIDRIEVQRGAGSTLYGSGAIGGVVNVITAKPEQGVQTKLRVMGGSNDLEQYAITNEGSQKQLVLACRRTKEYHWFLQRWSWCARSSTWQ